MSFQLSFTAVVFIYMALRRRPESEAPREPPGTRRTASPLRRRVLRELSSLVRLSIATWLGLFPIVAMVFNQVNLVGLPINVVVIPLMSAVLAGGLLLPWLGWIPGMGWLLTFPSLLLSKIAMWSDTLPGSSFAVNAPAWEWVLVFYLFVLLLLLRGMFKPGKFRRYWEMGTALGLIVGLAGLTVSMAPEPPPPRGRIAVLPGQGMGSVVAEAANGDIAVLGIIRRGGLNEAGWLHYRRRAGGTAVVAIGKAEASGYSALEYHYPIGMVTPLVATDASAPNRYEPWTMVPGARDIEYAFGRDGRGRLSWLAVRTGDSSICLVPRIQVPQFSRLVLWKRPGFASRLICAGYSESWPELPPDVLPPGWVAVRGRYRGELPERWFESRPYGVLMLGDALQAFDGEEWRTLGSFNPPGTKK